MGPDGNYPFNNILGADSLLRHFSVHVFLVLFLKMFLLCNLEWPWTLYLLASDSSCGLPCTGVNHLLITIRMRCQPHHMNFSWQSWLRLLHCQHTWELRTVQNYKPCISHGQDVFSWNLWPRTYKKTISVPKRNAWAMGAWPCGFTTKRKPGSVAVHAGNPPLWRLRQEDQDFKASCTSRASLKEAEV